MPSRIALASATARRAAQPSAQTPRARDIWPRATLQATRPERAAKVRARVAAQRQVRREAGRRIAPAAEGWW